MSVSKVENSYDVNIFLDGKNAFSLLYIHKCKITFILY